MYTDCNFLFFKVSFNRALFVIKQYCLDIIDTKGYIMDAYLDYINCSTSNCRSLCSNIFKFLFNATFGILYTIRTFCLNNEDPTDILKWCGVYTFICGSCQSKYIIKTYSLKYTDADIGILAAFHNLLSFIFTFL